MLLRAGLAILLLAGSQAGAAVLPLTATFGLEIAALPPITLSGTGIGSS
jgi:hypothetical protein